MGLTPSQRCQRSLEAKHCSHVPPSAKYVKLWTPCVETLAHVKEASGGQKYPKFHTVASLITIVAL